MFLDGLNVLLSLQSAPSASVAADIVYRHIPSATCVSEVYISPYIFICSYGTQLNVSLVQCIFITISNASTCMMFYLTFGKKFLKFIE